MKIELLYFEGCPSWQNALANLQTALRDEKLDIPVNLVLVKSNDKAEGRKFLGSPSIQLNGMDLWPEERENYAMSCRIYATNEGLKRWPSVEMFRQKFLALRKGKERKK